MPNVCVDRLLLLHLERGQEYRKGIYIYMTELQQMFPLEKSEGSLFSQVVYVTATLPYVMLLILLVRGLSLPGALQGVLFYLMPQSSRLTDPEVGQCR